MPFARTRSLQISCSDTELYPEKAMVRELVHDPLFLRLPSVEATKEDKAVVRDLLDTLAAHRETCVGMAANMIGERKNIIVFSKGFANIAMINAKIIKAVKPYNTEEGCLSLLGGPRKCKRYKEIEVEYLDISFTPKRGVFKDFEAEIIEHELDHVAGILI